ncbi:MAG: corrinoid protein [Lentihominibacter sp.]|nr:corrinoid protein [Clostridiales bacterium]MDY2680063.1 corrinoid protein [Lentihominibacter sp.]
MAREELMQKAFEAIVEADEDMAVEVLDAGAAEGITAVDLLQEGFSKGMNELGDQFSRGEIFLPELIFATEVMKVVTDRVDEELAAQGDAGTEKGKIVIGTVEGDVHDIGKGICVSMLKASGFEVYDLGREVPADTFIEKAEEVGADIIGTSALLTTTMTVQQELENKLNEKGIRDKYATMVGGSPVTKRWAEKIGATAYSEDASECCQVALDILANK